MMTFDLIFYFKCFKIIFTRDSALFIFTLIRSNCLLFLRYILVDGSALDFTLKFLKYFLLLAPICNRGELVFKINFLF